MKIRKGFVTNSSSSSFLVFDVKNMELYRYLMSLNITIENAEAGHFTGAMRVVLPSGEAMEIDMDMGEYLPSADGTSSLSAWIMAVLLWEIEDVWPAKEEDEYSEFTLELVKLLKEKGVLTLSDNVLEWDRGCVRSDLLRFDAMDASVESAHVEMNSGFEGEVQHLEYLVSKNGYTLSIVGEDEDGGFEGHLLEGARVYVAENVDNREDVIEFIENEDGILADKIDGSVDYVVCDENKSETTVFNLADDFCIPVISSQGFYHRFGGMEDEVDEEEAFDDLYECTFDGGFYDAFYMYGVGEVTRIKPQSTD